MESFVKDLKLRHTVLLNGQSLFTDDFELSGVPQTFWIDREGKVLVAEFGYGGASALNRRTKLLIASQN